MTAGALGIRWLTALIELPADVFEAGTRFWRAVTESGLSPPRTQPRIHVDLHVDSVRAAADRAIELGADEVLADGHVVLRSPSGLVFCE